MTTIKEARPSVATSGRAKMGQTAGKASIPYFNYITDTAGGQLKPAFPSCYARRWQDGRGT